MGARGLREDTLPPLSPEPLTEIQSEVLGGGEWAGQRVPAHRGHSYVFKPLCLGAREGGRAGGAEPTGGHVPCRPPGSMVAPPASSPPPPRLSGHRDPAAATVARRAHEGTPWTLCQALGAPDPFPGNSLRMSPLEGREHFLPLGKPPVQKSTPGPSGDLRRPVIPPPYPASLPLCPELPAGGWGLERRERGPTLRTGPGRPGRQRAGPRVRACASGAQV